MAESTTIRWDRGDDGVVVLTIDDPDASVNTINSAHVASMQATLDRLDAERESVTGVILSSGKRSFLAGGNLDEILAYRPDDAEAITAHVTRIKGQLRRLETLGIPVVAAIAGAALGGGLELALAAHHRVIADVPGAVVGFPEVGLGLLPAAGGIVRSVRMFGVQAAVGTLLTSGRRFGPAEALEFGLVDEVVADPAALLPAARAWIAANPGAIQPWDRPGFSAPGTQLFWPADPGALAGLAAGVRAKTKGAPAPALRAIVAAATEGALLGFDAASVIETRYFVQIAPGPVAKNLIRSTFFDRQRVNAGASRPAGVPERRARRVGVLGAGMMGAGIAYVSARAGLEVVLRDVTREAAERGVSRSRALADGQVARGRMSRADADALVARIRPTTDMADLAGVDTVVEAVFESVEVKQDVFRQVEPVAAPDALLASNTSTLPITTLAEGVRRAPDFIGTHFFSPVDRMPLVEIVVGERTSDATLAHAFDFARQLGKTPIVVRDSRGFFTSRVILARLGEAAIALGEGVPAPSIEQAALQSGYPAGPLQLLDEVTLSLPQKIRREAAAAAAAGGGTAVLEDGGSARVIDAMVDDYGRPGRAAGAGFYEYVDGARSRLWPGLTEAFPSGSAAIPFDDVKERLLFAEALEAVKCLDEGVLRTVSDANVGSLLGIGFPAWTGGVLRYIDSYPGGTRGFVGRARALAERYGDRFTPPDTLAEKAAKGEEYGA